MVIKYLALCLLCMLVLGGHVTYAQGADEAATLTVLDRRGAPVTAFTDGDLISLRLERSAAAAAPLAVAFRLDGAELGEARCTIAAGETGCTSAQFAALGWHWGDAPARLRREVGALLDASPVAGMAISVAPRPVVLVHGFISSAGTWSDYTAPGGYLHSLGLRGFAVGDGQAPGVLLTGDIENPTAPTNSIAENAAVLKQYIDGVKQLTGAEQVDLVAHSMGGLIARYYIDRLMPERDVAQLLMLGTSHGGSPCAQLPAALGWYLPAALELRPAYISQIFNRQITHRHGVPFYQLAGTSIVDGFKSPCTAVPSDLFVDRSSVSAIAAPVTELPLLHTTLTKTDDVFARFVAPHLQTQAGAFPAEPDPPAPQAVEQDVQFTRVLSGRVAAGGSQELTINLDDVAVAGFALFDPTHSLSVEVRGASGAVIALDPEKNGTIVVDDPSTLVHLGYGFTNPAPGPWRVTLAATPATPASGAPYAISTRVAGGAVLQAGVDKMVPQPFDTVVVTGSLALLNQPLAGASIEAVLRAPDGAVERRSFTGSEPTKQVSWTPAQTGIYTLDITASGRTADGATVERSSFLAFEVQPAAGAGRRSIALLIGGAVVLAAGLLVLLARRRRRRGAPTAGP